MADSAKMKFPTHGLAHSQASALDLLKRLPGWSPSALIPIHSNE
jgi:hypothetical protein